MDKVEELFKNISANAMINLTMDIEKLTFEDNNSPIYERLENYIKRLIHEERTTICGVRLLDINEDNEFYSNADLEINYYKENSFGIFTRYNDGKKEYVIYKVGERKSITYYNSYSTFKECLKNAKRLQKRQLIYNEEVRRISEEVEGQRLKKLGGNKNV